MNGRSIDFDLGESVIILSEEMVGCDNSGRSIDIRGVVRGGLDSKRAKGGRLLLENKIARVVGI